LIKNPRVIKHDCEHYKQVRMYIATLRVNRMNEIRELLTELVP